MVWTNPRTWVSGEIVSAPLLNTEIRDHLIESEASRATAARQTMYSTAPGALRGAALGVRKAADSTWNNSTTMAQVSDMVFSVGAGESWLAEYLLLVNYQSSMVGVSIGWQYSAGGGGTWAAIDQFPTVARQQSGNLVASGNAALVLWSGGPPPSAGFGNRGYEVYLLFTAVAAGVVQLLAAQNVADVQDTKILAGSTMLLTRFP